MQNKIERVALRDLVHRNLLERILQGHLQPGSRVKDTDLSEDLQVSRAPVRGKKLQIANYKKDGPRITRINTNFRKKRNKYNNNKRQLWFASRLF